MKRICRKQYEKDFDEMFKLDKKGLMTDIDCYVSNLENRIKRLEKENQELKKQLEEKQNPLKGIFAQVNDDMLLRNCGAMQSEIDEYKNQQKEFIEYLSGYIEMLSPPYSNNNEDIVKITKSILSKYKEIIGVSNEK